MPNGGDQRIFVDASMIGVAEELELLHNVIVYPGHPDWPFDQEEADDVWLGYIGDNDWMALARDKRIRYREAEKQALIDHRVRVVVISTRKNLKIEEMVDLIETNWKRIELLLGQPPALYHLTTSGIVRKLEYGVH